MRFLSLLILSATLNMSPCCLVYAGDVADEDGADSDGLLGDWRGVATTNGITPNVVVTADYAKPVQGANDNAPAVIGNLDVTLDVDLASLASIKGATLFIYFLANHSHAQGEGDALTDKVGSAQAISNTEAPTAAKLYEFWWDQRFLDNWSLRAGLYDLNSEFDAIESAAVLINSSFGIGPDFSQTGEAGPSIFPTTSLALRLKYSNDNGNYAQVALFDGVPGDPDNERGTHIKLGDGDGVLQVVELGTARAAAPGQRFQHVALGVWQYNPDQPVLAENSESLSRENNRGGYVLAEYQIYQPRENPAQGISLFARYGMASEQINPISRYAGLGLNWTGMFAGRDADVLGVGIAQARFGDDFRALSQIDIGQVAARERIVEISYRVQVLPWLALQPDVQWIEHPVFNLSSDSVVVALLRAEIIL